MNIALPNNLRGDLTKIIAPHAICHKVEAFAVPKVIGNDIILIYLTASCIAIFEHFHYKALIVSPPCFVTRGRVLIFIGRLVTPLSVDFVAHR